MSKLVRMFASIKMDRAIQDEHYISPGGYELNGKQFDFFLSEGSVNGDVTDFELSEFDDSLGGDSSVCITPEDLDGEFSEFFVYTGEYDEPEIRVNKVLSLVFEFDNGECVSASQDLLDSANRALG